MLLNSFKAYEDYCSSEDNLNDALSKSADKETESFYVEKLGANLNETFILVGCQIMPGTVKFPRSFLVENLKVLDGNNKEICER